eukprot:1161171-Pelagomonas_calceolata.AAC.10
MAIETGQVTGAEAWITAYGFACCTERLLMRWKQSRSWMLVLTTEQASPSSPPSSSFPAICINKPCSRQATASHFVANAIACYVKALLAGVHAGIECFLAYCIPQATALHFADLRARYGDPLIVLNLLKSHERRPREKLLRQELATAIKLLNSKVGHRCPAARIWAVVWCVACWHPDASVTLCTALARAESDVRYGARQQGLPER